jgi:hypothetical protein
MGACPLPSSKMRAAHTLPPLAAAAADSCWGGRAATSCPSRVRSCPFSSGQQASEPLRKEKQRVVHGGTHCGQAHAESVHPGASMRCTPAPAPTADAIPAAGHAVAPAGRRGRLPPPARGQGLEQHELPTEVPLLRRARYHQRLLAVRKEGVQLQGLCCQQGTILQDD